LRRGEGTGYIGIRRLQVQLPPAARAADSRHRSFRCGEGTRYFWRERPGNGPGRSRVRFSLALQRAIAQKKTRGPFVPAGMRCRDGAVQGYFSRKEAGMSPRGPGQIFLPAWSCPARIAYQPVVRAGAVESAATDVGATRNGMRGKVKRMPRSWTWCRTALLRC
jgi:hypothetical protein